MPDFPLLALETSTRRGSVALFTGAASVRSREVAMGPSSKDTITPAIHELVRDAGISAGSIRSIVTGAGPGSFTSLRIAAALAKGLAYASGASLYALPSLLFPAAAIGREGRYLIHSDAMRGERFVLCVDVDSALRVSARGVACRRDVVTLERWRNGEEEGPVGGSAVIAVEELEIDAASVLRLRGWEGNPVSLLEWEPDYGRLAEAQVKWETQHGEALPGSST